MFFYSFNGKFFYFFFFIKCHSWKRRNGCWLINIITLISYINRVSAPLVYLIFRISKSQCLVQFLVIINSFKINWFTNMLIFFSYSISGNSKSHLLCSPVIFIYIMSVTWKYNWYAILCWLIYNPFVIVFLRKFIIFTFIQLNFTIHSSIKMNQEFLKQFFCFFIFSPF